MKRLIQWSIDHHWLVIALSALLQVAVVQLPFLNDAFDTAPLELDEWLICLGLASVVLWADEAKKLIERRLRSRSRQPHPAAGIL